MRIGSVLGLVLGLAGCVSPSASREPAQAAAGEAEIHVLSTTDLHGYLLAEPTSGGLSMGGVDVMSAYFHNARTVDPETLLLDAGDLFQGTIISNSSVGATVIRWMNYAGYNAAAIGNHDFDFGPGDGHNVVLTPGEDPVGALKNREREAHFVFLSANICSLDEDPGQCADANTFKPASFSRPYIIKTVHGLRVATLGFSTPSTPSTTVASNVSRLKFSPIKPTLDRYVAELKAQGVNAIILVMHEGGSCFNNQCNPKDAIFHLIDQMSPDQRAALPLIIAGHTHTYVNTVYNGVHVLISGSYGHSFGYSTLKVSASGMSVESAQITDFCPKVYEATNSCRTGTGAVVPATFANLPITPDPQATSVIAKDIAAAQATGAHVIGTLASSIVNVNGPFKPIAATIGNLEADAFRSCGDSTCANAADIAFLNNSGIRTQTLPQGPITYKQIFETDPFDNFNSEISLNGRQIHDLIDAWFVYNHNDLPISVSGATITFSLQSPPMRTLTNTLGETMQLPDPVTAITLANGQPIDETKTYRVVMSDFLATGGSGTAFVLKGLKPTIHYDRIQRDQIVDYFKANPAGLNYQGQTPRLIQGQ